MQQFKINRSLWEDYSYNDDEMTIKIKVYDSMDTYNEWIIRIVDLVLDIYSRQLDPYNYKKLPVQEPEVVDSNQFQLLHLYALFGLNDKKDRITQYIQAGISPSTTFNYIYWISSEHRGQGEIRMHKSRT